MLREPLPAQSLNDTTHDRPAAATAAHGTDLGVIVELTVGAASMFKVRLPSKRTLAVGTYKTF